MTAALREPVTRRVCWAGTIFIVILCPRALQLTCTGPELVRLTPPTLALQTRSSHNPGHHHATLPTLFQSPGGRLLRSAE